MRSQARLLSSVLLAASLLRASGDAAIDRATMRGLKSVNVVLDPLATELTKAGLTQTELQTRLASRLKDAGVPVDPSATEFVGLRIMSVRNNRGPFAVAFNLGLYQPVVLVRDPNLKSAIPTWDIETVLLCDPKTLLDATMDTIDELAGRFAAAWRSVNPQGKPGPAPASPSHSPPRN